jgi:ATP-dependent Lon protease
MNSNKMQEIEIPEAMPLIPLRDMVIFPYMIFPLLIGRSSSMKAIEKAMIEEKFVFVVSQKNPTEEKPKRKDLFNVGTVVKVLQIIKLPNNVIKVLVEGVVRARLVKLNSRGGTQISHIEIIEEEGNDSPEIEAKARLAAALFKKYVNLNPNLPDEILASLDQIQQVAVLIDFIAAHVSQSVEVKQPILENTDQEKRLDKVHVLLEDENEILELERNIENQVREKMNSTQRTFYLQEQMRIIREELGEQADDDEGVVSGFRKKLNEEKLPKHVVARVEEELDRLRQMSALSPEANVIRNYLDWIFAIPWNKRTKDNLRIDIAANTLDEDHYGLDKPKERILEHLAVLKLVKKIKGQIICFAGPPGVGKTSLGRSIARALKRKFVRLSLGGLRDEAEIRGHRKTYIGAMPGRIIQSMKKAESVNPVILLDEIDKMAMDFRGDPSAALLEVLDPQQNNSFNDNYMELDYDLSQVMFITTANVASNIPPALRDRMEVIHLPGYLLHEKLQIARDFLIPRQLKEHGLKEENISFSDKAVEAIIAQYTQEAGVRTLERSIAGICRKVARKIVTPSKSPQSKQYKITPASLDGYLGLIRITERKAPEAPLRGAAIGLAWTSVGGDLLKIEVGTYPGKGRLQLTGKLGEVMQESAKAALTWLRMNASKYRIPAGYFDKNDLHIHVPEGAIPKDGPSAGITLVTAICSAVTGRPVRNDLAMTGELTLQGDVLPIGGLNEKSMAALRAGIKTILIPEGNKDELSEMHKAIKGSLEFVSVSHVDEVLQLALMKRGKTKK